MSKKIFTEKEVEILSKNQYVKNVSLKGITYTDAFKNIFIIESEKGELARIIFEKYGFNTEVLGKERIRSARYRWISAYNKDGIMGLSDTRKLNFGRPNVDNLSIEAKYERLQAQNNLLKAENELLKKIQFLERGMVKKK